MCILKLNECLAVRRICAVAAVVMGMQERVVTRSRRKQESGDSEALAFGPTIKAMLTAVRPQIQLSESPNNNIDSHCSANSYDIQLARIPEIRPPSGRHAWSSPRRPVYTTADGITTGTNGTIYDLNARLACFHLAGLPNAGLCGTLILQPLYMHYKGTVPPYMGSPQPF